MDGGSWFVSFCSFASRRFPALVKIGARHLERMRKKKGEKKPARLRNIGSSWKGVKKDSGPTQASRVEKSLRFTGISLEVEEVLAAAWLAGILASVAVVAAVVFVFILAGFGPMLYFLPFASIAPIAAYSLIMNYPEARARRMRIRSLGSAPEAVTYMAMSLKLSPSLNKAIEFAAENTEGPLADRLRGVLWDVYSRRKESIEESFMGFANDWGEWNEDLKRSLYGLLSAAGEGTQQGLDRGLERAQETVRAGARRRMEEFTASLKMPATAFFALCVLLPLIIGTTLPVLSLGGMGIQSVETLSQPQSGGGGPQLVLLLDVVFPAIAFLYSIMLLGRRPGTTGAPIVPPIKNRARRKWAAASLAVAAIPFLSLLTPASAYAPIAVIWSFTLGVSTYLVLSSADRRRRQRELRLLEQQMPDAIFIIGSKLGEGLSVEQALGRASESLKGLEVAAFLDRLRFSLQLHRRGLEETLFGREGILRAHPSRMVRVSLKMVVDLSRKDPSAAGKALVDFSHYLRDLQEVERDIKSKLGEIVDAMKSTASFFAPLVLGITSALYMLLEKSFGSIAPLPVSSLSFMAALGLYLVVMVPIIANFSVGLETGGDGAELAGFLGKAWPTSLGLFTLAAAFSVIGLGI